MNQVDKIMAYESGELDFDATVEFFQELIDTGLVWQLQSSYGRMANSLIENGYCELDMDKARIVCNRICTPDGTILESMHRHDYKTYEDANGLEYMVDGGLDYLRRNVHDDAPYIELSVYSDDSHDVIRDVFKWGTRGKDGKQPLTYVPLKNLTTEHIEAILETQDHIQEYIRNIFLDELNFRKIFV